MPNCTPSPSRGARDLTDFRGYGERTEGSDWIIHCAHRDDPRSLYLLVWGGIEDLADARHDDPTIKSKPELVDG